MTLWIDGAGRQDETFGHLPWHIVRSDDRMFWDRCYPAGQLHNPSPPLSRHLSADGHLETVNTGNGRQVTPAEQLYEKI